MNYELTDNCDCMLCHFAPDPKFKKHESGVPSNVLYLKVGTTELLLFDEPTQVPHIAMLQFRHRLPAVMFRYILEAHLSRYEHCPLVDSVGIWVYARWDLGMFQTCFLK